MTAPSPRLIVTLPARTVAEARAQIEEARASGADLAEVRFDRISPAERDGAATLFPTDLPLVATLRSQLEGGEGPDDRIERSRILGTLAGLPFELVDQEEGRDEQPLATAPPAGPPNVILSTHFPAGTPVSDLVREIERPVPPRTVRKVVLPASVGTVLRDLLPAIHRARASRGPTVVLTTGGSGPLLRALGRRLDQPFVYASLPEPLGSDSSHTVEPSQLPVDRLHRYFAPADAPPLFAVVGRPVFHSLSPAIHDRWMQATARAGLYLPLEVTSAEELEEAMAHLGNLGFRGLNVTHPWKSEALALARTSSPVARACRAANCLTFSSPGWDADNTDVAAATRRLGELRSEGAWKGDRLTVLGAGGAARATVLAAQSFGAKVTVVARRPEQAREVAQTLGCEVGDPTSPRSDPFVVHATSAGRESGHPLSIPLAAFLPPGGYLLDWVYHRGEPGLCPIARAAGARYESGERLLVYQAASSFARWWGTPPSPDAVRGVLGELGCAV